MPTKRPKALKMTARQVLDGLRLLHVHEAWGFFEEMGNAVGTDKYRHFDAYAVAYWKSLKHERRAYEVKISRGDFKREIDHPTKREQALSKSNTFYFATPKNLVSKDELPPECGLIEIDEAGQPRVVKRAPWRECEPPGWSFFLEMAKRASTAEQHNRTLAPQVARRRADKNPFMQLARQLKGLIERNGLTACSTCTPPIPRPSLSDSATWSDLGYKGAEKAHRDDKDRWWYIGYYREKLAENVKALIEKGAL